MRVPQHAAEQTGAAANWLPLQKVDTSDQINATVASPAAAAAAFFVEGVHETVAPLNPDTTTSTLRSTVPAAYFADVTMWPDS